MCYFDDPKILVKLIQEMTKLQVGKPLVMQAVGERSGVVAVGFTPCCSVQ